MPYLFFKFFNERTLNFPDIAYGFPTCLFIIELNEAEEVVPNKLVLILENCKMSSVIIGKR